MKLRLKPDKNNLGGVFIKIPLPTHPIALSQSSHEGSRYCVSSLVGI